MNMKPPSNLHHAILDLEGGESDVVKKASGRGAPGPEPPIPRGLPAVQIVRTLVI